MDKKEKEEKKSKEKKKEKKPKNKEIKEEKKEHKKEEEQSEFLNNVHHFMSEINLKEKAKASNESTIIKATKKSSSSPAARFQVLFDDCIRMEFSSVGRFEDSPSQAIWYRKYPTPSFTVENENSVTKINTSFFSLEYDHNEGFTEKGLSIKVHNAEKDSEINEQHIRTWKFGDENSQLKKELNLKGTVRTLDHKNGRVKLMDGLLCRSGYTIINDSSSFIFDIENDYWCRDRPHIDQSKNESENEEKEIYFDLYYIYYGSNYQRMLEIFNHISGKVPIIPRYVLGNWWSRWWVYSDRNVIELLNEFRENLIPLAVDVLDMDWHIVKERENKYHNGWTGYTWNQNLFPNPPKFLEYLRENYNDLKVSLNLHPADGIAPHELCYPLFYSRYFNKEYDPNDDSEKKVIEFDCTDKKFMQNYFELAHNPREKEGIDVWWIDWQQGSKSKLNSVDPLFWLNHTHTLNSEKFPYYEHNHSSIIPPSYFPPSFSHFDYNTEEIQINNDNNNNNINNNNNNNNENNIINKVKKRKRGIILSRYGGLGSQRYPLGFSGDSWTSWSSLAFQPYFTSTSSNVCYNWWSHDIGGFGYNGTEDPELFTRWVQFGVFSPILRLHSGKNSIVERLPWGYNDVSVLTNCKEAMTLRHKLISYIYSFVYQSYLLSSTLSLIRPIYHHFPDLPIAYYLPHEYFFGFDFLCVPFTSPANRETSFSKQVVYFPPSSSSSVPFQPINQTSSPFSTNQINNNNIINDNNENNNNKDEKKSKKKKKKEDKKQQEKRIKERREGERKGWFDFTNGNFYEENTMQPVYSDLSNFGVYVRSGGIIPLAEIDEITPLNLLGISPPSSLLVKVFTGVNNSFVLFEDDGNTTDYKDLNNNNNNNNNNNINITNDINNNNNDAFVWRKFELKYNNDNEGDNNDNNIGEGYLDDSFVFEVKNAIGNCEKFQIPSTRNFSFEFFGEFLEVNPSDISIKKISADQNESNLKYGEDYLIKPFHNRTKSLKIINLKINSSDRILISVKNKLKKKSEEEIKNQLVKRNQIAIKHYRNLPSQFKFPIFKMVETDPLDFILNFALDSKKYNEIANPITDHLLESFSQSGYHYLENIMEENLLFAWNQFQDPQIRFSLWVGDVKDFPTKLTEKPKEKKWKFFNFNNHSENSKADLTKVKLIIDNEIVPSFWFYKVNSPAINVIPKTEENYLIKPTQFFRFEFHCYSYRTSLSSPNFPSHLNEFFQLPIDQSNK